MDSRLTAPKPDDRKIRLLKHTAKTHYVPQNKQSREFLKKHSICHISITSDRLEEVKRAACQDALELVICDERLDCIDTFKEILKETDQPPSGIYRRIPRLYSFFRRPSSSWTEGPRGVFYVSLSVVLRSLPFDLTDLAGHIFNVDPCHLYFGATALTSAEIRLEGEREAGQRIFVRRISEELYGDPEAIEAVLL